MAKKNLNGEHDVPLYLPSFELLIAKYGLTTAGIFGKFYRYCSTSENHLCYASLQRLANELHLSSMTIKRKKDLLQKEGYITDTHTNGDTYQIRITKKIFIEWEQSKTTYLEQNVLGVEQNVNALEQNVLPPGTKCSTKNNNKNSINNGNKELNSSGSKIYSSENIIPEEDISSEEDDWGEDVLKQLDSSPQPKKRRELTPLSEWQHE